TPQILFCIFLTLLTTGSFYTMNRSMRSQRRLMQMKNDFISNISHELKTPVSTVTVAIEALERFKGLDDPAKTGEYLMMAKSELQRLTLMVDRILQTASSGVGATPGSRILVNMDKIVGEVLDSLKLLFEKHRIHPNYDKRGSDFSLHGDPQQLTTLVYNLLDNALKYTREAPTISLILEDRVDELVLSVRDNGVGIPEQYHKRVFEKFFRVPSGDVHDIRGYGLGLSYVASVVKEHHGSITLDSVPGEGTCFVVRLPKNGDQ
ncbi:MAG TPA: HAMP domain-containing sensor histidine kinase, partial [Chryseosolibacter sp.]|nr:HAMP domain-containing sensor histidine kinase [Chryseosolibacter sp.]